MVKQFYPILVLASCLTVFAMSDARGAADTEEVDNAQNYYKEFHPKGYYHYEIEPPAPVEEKVKPKTPPPAPKQPEKAPEKAPEKKVHREPSLSDYSYEEIWDMHPDDFRELLEDFGKKAMRRPTEQNVLEYFTLMDVVSRKSSAFAAVAGYVGQKYPELSRNEFPASGPGQTAVTRLRQNELEKGMEKAMGDFALLLFCRPNTEFCEKQEEVVKLYSQMTDGQVAVRNVDMDQNKSLAERFNVSFAPTIILIKRGSEEFFPVTTSLAAVPEIQYKTYQGMRVLNHEINPDQYGLYDYQRGGIMDNEAAILKNGRIRGKVNLKPTKEYPDANQ